jgi:hypothetical protein
MAKTPQAATLTDTEKSIIKALLNDGWRNQDIQVLINTGRAASINSGRISGIKKSGSVIPASKQQVEAFRRKKLLFDHVTGLCSIDDERLVRAREAMLLAVEIFNTPRVSFKAGVFSMLVNVAWTYLLHEYFERKGVTIVNSGGYSLLLSQMIERDDCPISKLCKKNLVALKEIRDVVEHRIIGSFDRNWLPLFQANCLNFESTLTGLFGPKLTLGHDLGFSLQFAKLSIEEIAALQAFDIPEHIAALDASLSDKLQEGDADNLEYQFKVVYTLTNASKSKAHFQFVQLESAEGKDIQNVLIKYKPIDDIYPLKPGEVTKLFSKKSGRKFTSDTHQKAWKMFKVRPKGGTPNPATTDMKYCVYHTPYDSYIYSDAWVDFLTAHIADDANWQKLRTFK